MMNNAKNKITKEQKAELWKGIEAFFLNHPHKTVNEKFRLMRHDVAQQNILIADAVNMIFLAKLAAYSLKHFLNYQVLIREMVDSGRNDNILQSELKLYMASNFMDENLNTEQLNILLSTSVTNNFIPKGFTVDSNYTAKDMKKFRDVIALFKRDYITICESHDYMIAESQDSDNSEDGE